MDSEILEVLKDIRGEIKETNVRLGSLEQRIDVRLEGLDGRVDFLEKRVSKGFDRIDARFEQVDGRLEAFATHLARSEAVIRREMNLYLDRLAMALKPTALDHDMLLDHEERITNLEKDE